MVISARPVTLVALLAVSIVVAPLAFAQRTLRVQPVDEVRVALVVGNSTYKDAPLVNPVNDAADMAQALQRAGFKVILKRNASSREMRLAIRDFGAELRRAQVGLFYFAGHGMQVKGENYLIPVGADIASEAEVEVDAVNANLALRTMEDANVKVSIVILDACRNNPFARGFRSAGRGLAQMNAATGSLIAFATAPNSTAADGTGRNGVYTKHLLASLNQPDTDILKVFQRARAGVVKETGGKQVPWESTSLIGDFYFRTPLPGIAQSGAKPGTGDPGLIELALWETVRDSRNPDELNAYLEQYPQGRFSSVARSRLKTLGSATPARIEPQPVASVAGAAPPAAAIMSAADAARRVEAAIAAAMRATGYQLQVGQAGKDVIWVPTPFEVVEALTARSKPRSGELLVDLGSGEGRIPLYAALRYGIRTWGIEYNPPMVEVARRAAAELGLTERVTFTQGDVFAVDFSRADIVTMYLLPSLLQKLKPRLLAMRPGTRIASHSFTFEDWTPEASAEIDGRRAYFWTVPVRTGALPAHRGGRASAYPPPAGLLPPLIAAVER
jgi:SAM-dependent methyltransferase